MSWMMLVPWATSDPNIQAEAILKGAGKCSLKPENLAVISTCTPSPRPLTDAAYFTIVFEVVLDVKVCTHPTEHKLRHIGLCLDALIRDVLLRVRFRFKFVAKSAVLFKIVFEMVLVIVRGVSMFITGNTQLILERKLKKPVSLQTVVHFVNTMVVEMFQRLASLFHAPLGCRPYFTLRSALVFKQMKFHVRDQFGWKRCDATVAAPEAVAEAECFDGLAHGDVGCQVRT
jgi:hypothetical protein